MKCNTVPEIVSVYTVYRIFIGGSNPSRRAS